MARPIVECPNYDNAPRNMQSKDVPPPGIEPETLNVERECSASELLYGIIRHISPPFRPDRGIFYVGGSTMFMKVIRGTQCKHPHYDK